MELHELGRNGTSKSSNRMFIQVVAHTWLVRVPPAPRARSVEATRNRTMHTGNSRSGLTGNVDVLHSASRSRA